MSDEERSIGLSVEGKINALIAETCGRIASLTSESVLRSQQLEVSLVGTQAFEAHANGAHGRRAFAAYAAHLRKVHAIHVEYLEALERLLEAEKGPEA